MNLWKHQQRFLEKNPARCLVVWDTGTGKTRASLEWASQNRGHTLVIVPKSLKENWWREVSKHAKNGATFSVMTKEEFRKLWDDKPGCDNLIVDEAHFFAGMKSQMSKNLRKYLKKHNVPNILLMTATPVRSTPWDLFTLAGHLGYAWGYMSFRFKFFRDKYIGRKVVPEVKPGIEGELADLVRKIGDVVSLDECADVPDQVFEVEYFALSEAQRKAIDLAYDPMPIVRFTKTHQIENGALKGDGYTPDRIFDCDKTERILDIVEATHKIAVVCRYNAQIDYLSLILRAAHKPIFIIRGDVKDRDAVVREAESSRKAVVLIQADCAEGYELPSIGVIVFASMSFSYVAYKQMLGRFLRLNKLKKNVYVHLLTKDGIDEAVYGAIMRKQNFDIELYEGERFSD